MLDKLLNSPHLKEITFLKDAHTYFVNGTEYNGFTSLISKYKKPFEKQKMSKFVAMRDGKSQDEVLDEWAETNKIAIEYGSSFHDAADEFITDYVEHPDFVNELSYIIKMLDMLDLEPLVGEYLVANHAILRASSIDLICLSRITNKLVVVDYKTPEKGIKYEGYKNQKMLHPLFKLEDCSYNHYSFQISMYIKELQNLGFDVEDTGYLFYIRPDDYAVIPTIDLREDVDKVYQLESFNQ